MQNVVPGNGLSNLRAGKGGGMSGIDKQIYMYRSPFCITVSNNRWRDWTISDSSYEKRGGKD